MAARAALSSRISSKSDDSGAGGTADALARTAHQDPPKDQQAEEDGFRRDECERGRADSHHFP